MNERTNKQKRIMSHFSFDVCFFVGKTKIKKKNTYQPFIIQSTCYRFLTIYMYYTLDMASCDFF